MAILPAVLAGLLAVGMPAAAVAQTQTELNQQSGAAYARAEAQHTALVQALARQLSSDDDRAAMLDAEARWDAFRDAECRFETMDSDGGSVHPMAVADCRRAVTLDRLPRLRWLLNCQEGTILCPAKQH